MDEYGLKSKYSAIEDVDLDTLVGMYKSQKPDCQEIGLVAFIFFFDLLVFLCFFVYFLLCSPD